jgi:hypothetical protein
VYVLLQLTAQIYLMQVQSTLCTNKILENKMIKNKFMWKEV